MHTQWFAGLGEKDMGVFSGDDFNRLDWRLLQNGAVSLYYRATVLEADIAWLAEHGYCVHEFDCAAWTSENDFHDALAACRCGENGCGPCYNRMIRS